MVTLKRILNMAKRFFIRKSHTDMLQEQNKLLQEILDKQEKPVLARKDLINQVSLDPIYEEQEIEIIDFNDMLDTPAYIPTVVGGDVKLSSVSTDKVSFDETEVEKLRRRRNAKMG